MAKLRVFISSTFYDLKQIRADLDKFITGMGYEVIRNETGDIPYGKNEGLEEYCYKEILEVDMLIGIIGGRYGSQSKHELYSITQTEIKEALKQEKKVYIFIEKNVYTEHQTYRNNTKNNKIDHKQIDYYFSDNIRIFEFISEIESLQRNNSIKDFETADDITNYLKEQWSGLFRSLLNQEQQQYQFGNISSQINELSETNKTFKHYLEEVIKGVTPSQGKEVIAQETDRLKKLSDLSSI